MSFDAAFTSAAPTALRLCVGVRMYVGARWERKRGRERK